MSADLWNIALSQINLPSFFGQFCPSKDPLAPGSYKPPRLEEAYEWFKQNPTSTITVLDLMSRLNFSNPSAYRVVRILQAEGKIHQHKFPGRKNGIQYGLFPQVNIPTAKDIPMKPSLGTIKRSKKKAQI